MSLRQTLRKAAGLLVELPPDEPPVAPMDDYGESRGNAVDEVERVYNTLEVAPAKTVEQIVREAPGPNLDQITVDPSPKVSVSNADGTLNYAAIYQSASLPPAPFSAEQVLELMASMPESVPLDTRRQMVKVSISAMGKSIGASPEAVVADASRKLAALAAYSDHVTQLTTEYVTAAEAKIAGLEAQVQEMEKGIAAAREKQERESQACVKECDRLDDVLEFFSLDVAPSKYAPPS